MATTKYTKKTTTAKKDTEEKTHDAPEETPDAPEETPDAPEEIVYDTPVVTTELLELEILRSTTCEEEAS